MKTAILNGRVIDPASGFDALAGVYVDGEKIAAIGAQPADFAADESIDASGLVVAPGFVDLCARLREPGGEFKNALASEMHAAVAGGVTCLVCAPDTDPVLDEPGLVEMLRYRAKNLRGPRVFPAGALTEGLKGERLTEMAELREHGCVAFSQADAPLYDTQVMLRALQYAATFGFIVVLRPDDAWLSRDGVAHEGPGRGAPRPATDPPRGRNHRDDAHPRTGASDAGAGPPGPAVDGTRGRAAARGESGKPAGHR